MYVHTVNILQFNQFLKIWWINQYLLVFHITYVLVLEKVLQIKQRQINENSLHIQILQRLMYTYKSMTMTHWKVDLTQVSHQTQVTAVVFVSTVRAYHLTPNTSCTWRMGEIPPVNPHQSEQACTKPHADKSVWITEFTLTTEHVLRMYF